MYWFLLVYVVGLVVVTPTWHVGTPTLHKIIGRFLWPVFLGAAILMYWGGGAEFGFFRRCPYCRHKFYHTRDCGRRGCLGRWDSRKRWFTGHCPECCDGP